MVAAFFLLGIIGMLSFFSLYIFPFLMLAFSNRRSVMLASMKSKLSERDKARIPVLEENLKKAQMEALNIEAEIEKIMSNYLPRKLVMEFFFFLACFYSFGCLY